MSIAITSYDYDQRGILLQVKEMVLENTDLDIDELYNHVEVSSETIAWFNEIKRTSQQAERN